MSAGQNYTMGAALSMVILAIVFHLDPSWAFNDQQAVAFGIVCGGLWHGIQCLAERLLPPRKTAPPAAPSAPQPQQEVKKP